MLPILLLGFLLGLRHALDVDHVVAVTTIVTRERSLARASLVGAAWGIGHTVTILVVGVAIILFDVVISPGAATVMELLVALMLIVLGVVNLVGAFRGRGAKAHVHPHAPEHPDAHDHDHPAVDKAPRGRLMVLLRPMVIGVVHGMGGSAALTLIVLTTVRAPEVAVFYLLIFGLGTVGGMMLITMGLALSFRLAAQRFAVIHRHLGWITGIASLGLGLYLAYDTCIAEGFPA